MGQVTVYLDDRTETVARDAAKREGISLSKWVAHRIQGNSLTKWPEFIRDLAGAWPELPSAEQIRRSAVKDARRRRL